MKPVVYLSALASLFAALPLAHADAGAANALIAQAQGDLDGDGKPEYVEVRNTANDQTDGLGYQRVLLVYKQNGGQKKLWQRSDSAAYPSKGGGMMGDPFGELHIKNGSLFLSQSGGSSWKWGHTDQYRYQNGQFELIGYQSTAGRICDYWQSVDANFSTGKINYRKEFDRQADCDSDEYKGQKDIRESFVNKNVRLNFGNRNAQEVKVIAPKSKEAIYFANPL